MAEGLAADAILLGREVEGDVALKDAVDGRSCSIVGGVTDEEGDVAQAEGVLLETPAREGSRRREVQKVDQAFQLVRLAVTQLEWTQRQPRLSKGSR
jgi:hypothetical protein